LLLVRLISPHKSFDGSRNSSWISEWENLDYHKVYLTSDTIPAVMGVVSTVMDTTRPVTSYHIPSNSEVEKVLSAPVVEVCRFSNTPSMFEEKFAPFYEEMKKSKGFCGLVHGWAIEEENGKEFVALVGWDSIEAHTQAVSSEHLQEEYIKAKPHAGYVDLHHVAFARNM
jgi:quinol monooxygenase YgiN